jgi:hypothetical protein
LIEDSGRGPLVGVLVSWWIGEAMLLIELTIELVNKEEEGKEDEEDKGRTT